MLPVPGRRMLIYRQRCQSNRVSAIPAASIAQHTITASQPLTTQFPTAGCQVRPMSSCPPRLLLRWGTSPPDVPDMPSSIYPLMVWEFTFVECARGTPCGAGPCYCLPASDGNATACAIIPLATSAHATTPLISSFYGVQLDADGLRHPHATLQYYQHVPPLQHGKCGEQADLCAPEALQHHWTEMVKVCRPPLSGRLSRPWPQ